ncbi:hypothetical protein FGO68_gene8719 [Halteria grandinella]|uniref:EF-hand domain-containing protein n=1 Tax=Halteria grandinella TaxID=5974 RepID=A0A8J8NGC9_HALGN|nr:hypothetical protein FGO68_gene8719 [Halteria grandinella]
MTRKEALYKINMEQYHRPMVHSRSSGTLTGSKTNRRANPPLLKVTYQTPQTKYQPHIREFESTLYNFTRNLAILAQLEASLSAMKHQLLNMPGFDCYKYFRYLSRKTSQLSPQHIAQLYEIYGRVPKNSEQLLSLFQSSEGGASHSQKAWTYSEFLRFLISSSDQLSNLLLRSFQPTRPKSAMRNPIPSDSILERFDHILLNIIDAELSLRAFILQSFIYTLEQAKQVWLEVTRAEYILESDLVKVIRKHENGYREVGGLEEVLKRMDVGRDGMVSWEDFQGFMSIGGEGGTSEMRSDKHVKVSQKQLSVERSSPLRLVVVPPQIQYPKQPNLSLSHKNRVEELRSRAALKTFLNPPLSRKQPNILSKNPFSLVNHEAYTPMLQDSTTPQISVKLLDQSNPRHSNLSAKFGASFNSSTTLQDTFLEVIANPSLEGSLNNSHNLQLMLQRSSSKQSPTHGKSQAIDVLIGRYFEIIEQYEGEIERIRLQLQIRQREGKFDIMEAFREMCEQGMTINEFLFRIEQRPYCLKLNWREAVLFFKQYAQQYGRFSFSVFCRLLSPNNFQLETIKISEESSDKLIAEVIKLCVQSEMDLEMIRFEVQQIIQEMPDQSLIESFNRSIKSTYNQQALQRRFHHKHITPDLLFEELKPKSFQGL